MCIPTPGWRRDTHLSNTITLFFGLLKKINKPQPDKFGNYLVNVALHLADNKTSIPPGEQLEIHKLPAKNKRTQLFYAANFV